MHRRFIVAGNWKMHGSRDTVMRLVKGITDGAAVSSDIDIVLFPTYVHLAQVHALLQGTAIVCGAQNLYPGTQGAFTGEVSGPMLVDAGCCYALIGHSERRAILHEGLELVAAKFQAAQQAGLIPLLCVGETQAEREHKQTEQVIAQQLASVMEKVGAEAWSQAVIAYEPIWAIGTGLTATPEQAQHVHAFIRAYIAKQHVAIAGGIRILYGGSVKPDNAAQLFAMPDIDGGLIGGASLDAKSFLAICAAANKSAVMA
ncbi:MAG: triose-phosphate isomerase [Gammaproteobacteria bacterium RIFCSPHIGHO2_12_FULL_41_20]|nr:MAG: triose-phosphate isomerase [Gammaproteobacteria bacterium RIFCSPHIGHO2_12_FULL_41_20]